MIAPRKLLLMVRAAVRNDVISTSRPMDAYCEATSRLRISLALNRDLVRFCCLWQRARVLGLRSWCEAETIWRRTSSIDGVDELSAGSCRPRTSQRNFILPINLLRLGGAFIHHDGYDASIVFLQLQNITTCAVRSRSA